jgi:putative transposase
MKRSKFTEPQIAFILRQAEEGTAVGEVCRKAGISEATLLQLAQEVRRFDAVGDEAAAPARGREQQPKEDRRRSIARQGDVAGRHPPKTLKPARKRQMVDHARSTWRVSIRRACRALPVDRSTYHYRSRRAGQAQLTERIREIAATRVRYGYRRIHVLLRREGWKVNAKRIYRLYRELGLQLRNKTPKRRVKAKLRSDRQPATRANQTWAMDFVHDQLATGRKLRVLTIIDTFSRFSPAVEPRFTFCGADVVEILEEVGRQVGFPAAMRVDQGTEFVSRDLDLWAYQRGVILDFSRPGKPTDNAFIESFNGKFRTECLNAHWFMSLDDARRKCEAWRRDYNEERPHSAIGNKVPVELIDRSVAHGPP